MANDQHVEWLKEGVEEWNARRESDSFKPDLSGENLYEEFQDHSNLVRRDRMRLSEINLRDANLKGTNFKNADVWNADFTNANLQGAVLANAELRGADFTNAKLQGADLTNLEAHWNTNFTSANFRGANLTGAELRRANLTNAKLQGVDFTSFELDRPELKGANLQGAKLTKVDLKKVDLTEADLKGTKLCGADLTDANLANSKIQNANISRSNLANANFAGTQPWETKLYSNESQGSPRRVSGRRSSIKGTGNLLKESNKLIRHHKENYDGEIVLYFRGETQCGWQLRPSVMRSEEGKHTESESEMLLELIARRPEQFNDATSALAEWVLAQHHGLPTRFLDVTRNPLVALFNACKDDADEKDGRLHIFAVPRTLIKQFNSDAISIIANLAKLKRQEQKLLLGYKEDNLPYGEYEIAKIRLYQAIKQEKPYFEERIDIRDLYKVFVVEPRQFSERIRAQSGAFLVSAFHEDFDRDAIVKVNKQNPPPVYSHYKLTIPKGNKNAIMEELRLLNITTETLFPGLDSAAEAVKGVYSRP